MQFKVNKKLPCPGNIRNYLTLPLVTRVVKATCDHVPAEAAGNFPRHDTKHVSHGGRHCHPKLHYIYLYVRTRRRRDRIHPHFPMIPTELLQPIARKSVTRELWSQFAVNWTCDCACRGGLQGCVLCEKAAAL